MHWLNTTLELLSPGWVGTIASLLGLIVGLIAAVVTRQRTRLAYCCAGKRLLGLATDGLPAGVTVHYRGQDISRLTRTLVVLWNAGEKTILGEDIVAADPLRLKLRGDGRVLAATVLKTKRDVCQIEASLSDASCPNETHIRFDFLDAGDGAVVEVLHTSEDRYVKFLGTIRGLPQGLHNFGIIQPSDNRLELLISIAGFIAAISSVAVVSITTPEIERLCDSGTIAFDGYAILLGGLVVFSIVGIALICRIRRRYPKCLNIEELREH